MRLYCQQVEQENGVEHRKELDFMVEWYTEQFNNFNNILQLQMVEQLNQMAYDCTMDYNQTDYIFSFSAVLSPFCIADFLCKHLLSTFSYGPEIVGKMTNFSPSELRQSWFEYHGDAFFVVEILQDYFNRSNLGKEINLNVILEERTIRSNFVHRGSLELCMSLIRFYNVIRRMLIFMNKSYDAKLPEFEYPQDICCDIQALSGHFDFDNFANKTTVLITDSLHDVPQNQLALIANMPWNIIIDFDSGTIGGGLKDSVKNTTINKQLLTMSVANGITISRNITNWLKCGEFLTPTPSDKLQKLFATKLPFYNGNYHRYYRYIHDIFEPIFSTIESEQNPVSVLFLHHDDGILKQVIDLCEEYLDSVSYSLSAVYYWEKEKCISIENDKFSTYIRNSENYSDRFKIFPCDVQSFFKGLEIYNVLPQIKHPNIEDKQLPTMDGPKVVPINLITRLEKYFEVLYSNCGNEDTNIAEQMIADFHMGAIAPWCAFSNGEVVNTIRKSDYDRWIQRIKTILGKLAEANTYKIFNLIHKPGIGGSTKLRYIGWSLHNDYPVLVANKYERLKIKNLLEDLYDQHSSKGILVLVDEEYEYQDELERDIKELSRPCAMVISKRVNASGSAKQDLPFSVITGEAEKKLKHIFKKISPLDKLTIERKDREYDDYIGKDPSMKSPFFIGLYYIEREFKHLNEYIAQVTKKIYNKKEIAVLGLVALCDIYGPAYLPAVFINKYLGINLRNNYLLNNSNVSSILYYGKTSSGTMSYISKHVLISTELLEQCSNILYEDSYKNTLHKWAESLIDIIFHECHERYNENYKTILEKIFIKNRIIDEQNEADFSKLILDISIPEYRKNILTKLANESRKLAENANPEKEPSIYMMAAHFFGHLSRIYSKNATELVNYEKAVEYSKKSMYYLEECNGQDSIIYHMHGDALRLLFKEKCAEIINSGNEVANSEFINLEDKIHEIRHYYDIAAKIGGNIYAATSTIRLLIDYLKFVYQCKNIVALDDIDKLSSNQYTIRLDVEEVIHSLDLEELDEKNKMIYNNLLDEYQSRIMFGDYSHAIQYFQNRMDYLISHQGSINEISSVRQSLINARLAKYRKNASNGIPYYSLIPVKEVDEILELLEKSFEQNIDVNNFAERHSRCIAYNKWMNLAKYSKRDITKGIIYAKQWKALVERDHRYDPNPYYYLYVLCYLSVLEGNKDDEKHIEEYRKLSYTYANNRGNRVDYIRDIFISGTGMGQLCDANIIADWGKFTIKKPIKLVPFEGRFDAVESKKGIVVLQSPIKWSMRKAKFQTRENNSLSDEQKTHTVSFYGGFSYEMISAINSTVRDITSGETLPSVAVSQSNTLSTSNKINHTRVTTIITERDEISDVRRSQESGLDSMTSNNAKGFLPDYQGSVLFEIKEIKHDKVVGSFAVKGHIYDGQITTNLSRKKINDLKGKKCIRARIVGHNDFFYILRC